MRRTETTTKAGRLLLLTLCCIALLVSPAEGGTFEVVACDAAPGFANNSWRPDANHGGMVAYSACPAGDNPRLGLGAVHNEYPSGYTVPTGSAARWFFDAPANTAIVGIRADALFEWSNFRWQSALSNGSQIIEGCPSLPADPGGQCAAGMYANDYVAIPPSGVIYTEAYCVRGPCPVGGLGKRWVRAALTYAAVTLTDWTAPGVLNPHGRLWTDGWVSGTGDVGFDATDNTGIKAVQVLVDGRVMAADGRQCDPTQKTCPDWPGAVLSVATSGQLGDGRHQLAIQVTDRGDNVGTAAHDLLVDNTPPAAPEGLAVSDGDGWRAKNSFELSWRNPSQQAAPIVGAEYRLCRGDSKTDCVSGSRAKDGIDRISSLQVPAPGDWSLTLWLRDAAGNARPETAALPAQLRFDAEPPTLSIEPMSPDDPVRVRVRASDTVSGIARGEIEMRRAGSDTWRSVPAGLEAGGFSGAIEDEKLADGVYDLRARTWDAAGNERSSEQLTDGTTARVTLPLRVKTSMRVGKTRRLRAKGAHRGRRIRTVYVRRPLVGHGRWVRLGGRLTAPGGNPLQDVDVEVSARLAVEGATFSPVATLRTSGTGRFSYLLPRGPSRVIQFRYPGTARIRPQTREVDVRVRASSSIRRSPRRVVNGDSVTFAGRLLGDFLPAGGKLVELQFYDRGRWRTFRTVRSAPSTGRWSYSYRFDGTHGTRTYRFRVMIPRENGYPYATGASRKVAVTVRGF
jgi:hypothetical protein